MNPWARVGSVPAWGDAPSLNMGALLRTLNIIMDLTDIGANLGHESYEADLPEVLKRASQAGVSRMIVTGACGAGSRRALALAEAHPGHLWATAGLHPHHALDFNADLAAGLSELWAHDAVVAIGETGLDYFRDLSPRARQQAAFEWHLDQAARLGKPMFLHQRDAHEDFHAMLRPLRDKLGGVLVHCFTDQRRALHAYLDLDCHIGITGWICDERRGLHLRELVRDIPADRLLVETDCPYLLPRDLPVKPPGGRRNEPCYLPHIVKTIAACRAEHPRETAAASDQAAQSFFRLPQRIAATETA